MEASIEYAKAQDASDEFAKFREQFYIPQQKDGTDEVYLCGNSLGLQPRNTKTLMLEELDKWAQIGVKGHFEGERPWMPFHKILQSGLANVVGAKETEVIAMNSLTANLHFMMVSFYKPTDKRHKIIIEEHAFPSDHYAVESQIKYHGFDPESSMVLVKPREGEEIIRDEDVLAVIEEHKDELALVMMPGVQYYTGQVFDMKAITEAGHKAGAYVGFDLAHAVGNIPLELNAWGADFAVWCHYKYLNSGPGAVGGCFVAEKHCQNRSIDRFAGWWGHNQETRFKMENKFDPMPTAEGWQLSNPPITSLVCIKASLDLFEKAGGVAKLREKAEKLFHYMDFLLKAKLEGKVEVLTPAEDNRRGCQLSLAVHMGDKAGAGEKGKKVFDYLENNGVTCDWRYPNVIRVAAAPIYNSFLDVWKFINVLSDAIAEVEND